MSYSIKETVDAIDNINGDLFEKTDNESIIVELKTTGCVTIIEFCGISIWSSEDDDRQYIDQIDEYEPIEPFLRKKVNEVIETITKIKSI